MNDLQQAWKNSARMWLSPPSPLDRFGDESGDVVGVVGERASRLVQRVLLGRDHLVEMLIGAGR
jgi:hypothetical protein